MDLAGASDRVTRIAKRGEGRGGKEEAISKGIEVRDSRDDDG